MKIKNIEREQMYPAAFLLVLLVVGVVLSIGKDSSESSALELTGVHEVIEAGWDALANDGLGNDEFAGRASAGDLRKLIRTRDELRRNWSRELGRMEAEFEESVQQYESRARALEIEFAEILGGSTMNYNSDLALASF